jgi:hypothetical protein
MKTDLEEALDNQFNDFTVMFELLWDDVIKTGEPASKTSSIGYERRSAVRACFAFIEGVMTRTESLCTLIQVTRGDSPKKKSLDAMMSNVIRQIPENRTDDNKDKRKFVVRLKESLKSLATVAGKTLDLSTQGNNLLDIGSAVKVRDRLMHPKVAKDLVVSDQEFISVMNSTAWYRRQYDSIMAERIAKMEARAAEDAALQS